MFSIYKFSEVHALILRILIIYDILFSGTSLRKKVFHSLVFNAVFSFCIVFFRRNSATNDAQRRCVTTYSFVLWTVRTNTCEPWMYFMRTPTPIRRVFLVSRREIRPCCVWLGPNESTRGKFLPLCPDVCLFANQHPPRSEAVCRL